MKKKIFSTPQWWCKKYDGRRSEFRGVSREEFNEAKEKAFRRRYCRSREYDGKSDVRRAYELILDYARPENEAYQKVAMYGYTWLYLCSPVYGHGDYNKARILPIDGNERECEFLIRVSNRVASGKQ